MSALDLLFDETDKDNETVKQPPKPKSKRRRPPRTPKTVALTPSSSSVRRRGHSTRRSSGHPPPSPVPFPMDELLAEPVKDVPANVAPPPADTSSPTPSKKKAQSTKPTVTAPPRRVVQPPPVPSFTSPPPTSRSASQRRPESSPRTHRPRVSTPRSVTSNVIWSPAKSTFGARGGPRKSDPVAMYHAHQRARLVHDFNYHMKRSSTSAAAPSPRPATAPSPSPFMASSPTKTRRSHPVWRRPTVYVPPTEKRRDKLRSEVRERMRKIRMAAQGRPARSHPSLPSPYKVPSSKLRRNLVWQVRTKLSTPKP